MAQCSDNPSPFCLQFYDGILYERTFFNLGDSYLWKGLGIPCYFEDLYILNKNSVGFKKHLSENFDPELFKDYLLGKTGKTGINAVKYAALFLEQYDVFPDKIVAKNKNWKVEDPRSVPILLEIPKDHKYYDKLLKCWQNG